MASKFTIFQQGQIITITNRATLRIINNKEGRVDFQYSVESDLDVVLRVVDINGNVENPGNTIRIGQKQVYINWNISPQNPSDIIIQDINPTNDGKYEYVW